MKKVLLGAGVLSLSMGVAGIAQAQEYSMTCEEYMSSNNLEVTEAAKERFANLRGACMGLVERDGEMYMHTKMVVRRVSGSQLTLYLPATDSTFTVSPDSSARVQVGGRRVRPRELSRGDELNMYVAAAAITQPRPMIEEVMMETESEELVPTPAAAVAALPTTG